MRVAPSLSFRRLAACVAVIGIAGAPAVGQGDVSRAELDALEAEREQTLQQLAALEQAGSAVAGDLEGLERDLISAAMESQRREEQATSAEFKLVSLRTRLGSARTELVNGESALEDLMASLALSGRHRPPALLTQPQDANQAIRAAILMGEVAPQVRARTTALGDEITSLRKLERQVLREQKSLAAAEAALLLSGVALSLAAAPLRALWRRCSSLGRCCCSPGRRGAALLRCW
ncbi:MAG: hypothetical protein VXW22_16425, partial [Pseudomonadota bacterium]|nr:hypothetical protein [Pseudomonadota bacterium]